MAILNVAKPSTTLANSAKVASFETWATITTTWATETRTWLATGNLLANSVRTTSSLTNVAKPA